MLTAAILDGCISVLSKSPILLRLLRKTAETMPSDQPWYFIGGCIYQTVWNVTSEKSPEFGIKDYDLVYFDRHSGLEQQQEYESQISAAGQVTVEVVNQALITDEWFERAFGCPKDTTDYLSLEDSIAKAYVSTPIVGVTWKDEQVQLLALADADRLLNLEVLPNRRFRDERVMPFYRGKCVKWHDTWPMVKYHEWDRSF